MGDRSKTFKVSCEIFTFLQVGKDNVFPALSLISYKPEYQKAMEFLLGNVFIATSGDVAKRVTFNPEVRKKSITLDGEVYDHSGKVNSIKN